MNNQDIFEKRAAARSADKFNISTPQLSNESLIEEDVETPQKDIFEQRADLAKQKEDNKFSFIDTIKDVGQQVVAKGIAGAAGAYGNIADLIGIQPKKGEQLPGEKARNSQQFNVLEKLSRGEVPSLGEFLLLADDDIAPSYSRLSNTEDVKELTQELTGIGEGKTPAGRITGRGAEFLGEGAAFGGNVKGLISLTGAGVAGQTVRELGGPEALATGVEIAGSIGPSLIEGRLRPGGTAGKKTVDAGRKIGLTENEITPLIQSETKAATLANVSRKGNKTKELFASIKEKLGDSYSRIKSTPQAKQALPNAEQINLRREFGLIRNDLSKTLAPSPEKEAAIKYIENALNTLQNINVTPEHLVNFWQDVNKTVKWNSIQGGKKALARLKQPVSDVLKKVSPQLAEDFEMTNELYTKYAQISKKLKPDMVDAFLNKAELFGAPAAGLAFAQGNPYALAGLAGESSLRLLAREMLINPYFQNLGTKLVQNFNSGSLKAVTTSVKQAQEYMERKHPNEDWSFLTDPQD